MIKVDKWKPAEEDLGGIAIYVCPACHRAGSGPQGRPHLCVCGVTLVAGTE